jgi:hypothetical protein
MWHDARVMPYIDMSVKGWVWYQGENDMHNLFGAENTILGAIFIQNHDHFVKTGSRDINIWQR